MNKVRRPWLRGVITLVALAGLAAGLLASSASSAPKPVTKKKAKKVATKVATQLDNSLATRTGSRLAFARDDNDALVGPATADVLSVQITAPAPGLLAINAGSDVFGGTGFTDCILRLNGADLPSTERSLELRADNTEEDCTTEGAVAVDAGTHTVALRANPPATVRYDEAVLWVMWVPFDAGGAAPTSFTPGRSSAGLGN